jgi:hypothetical protein
MLAATAALAADYAGTIDLIDRTEFRVRTTEEVAVPTPLVANTNANVGYDLFTQPILRVRLYERTWELEASYAPSFTFADLEFGFTPTILHSGDLRAAWRDRFVTLGVIQAISYGQTNGAYVVPNATQQPAPGQPPLVTAALTPTTIDYIASRSGGSVGVRVGRRDVILASAEYDINGGTNAASRAVAPEQSGPRANVAYEYAISRRDQVLTNALFQGTDFIGLQCLPPDGNPNAFFSCAPQSRIFEVGEALHHLITRRAYVSVGAGFAATMSRLQTEGTWQTAYYPTGEAVLSIDFPAPSGEAYGVPVSQGGHPMMASTLRLSGRLGPLVDIRTGDVFNSVGAEGSFAVPASQQVAFQTSAGFLQYLPTYAAGAVSLAHSEVEVDYALDPFVSFALGGRGVWQSQNGFGAFVSTYAYVALTVREQRFTF